MPFPPHTLITWSGTWQQNPAETWTCSLRLGGLVDGDDSVDQALLDAVRPIVEQYHQSGAVPSDARLTGIKCNRIGPDGKYVKQGITFQHDYTTPLPSGGTSGILPLQCTVAVSFTTIRTRGIASRGRLFSPGVAPSELAADGSIQPARQAVRANAAAALIGSLATAGTNAGAGVPSVVSAGALQGTGRVLPSPSWR